MRYIVPAFPVMDPFSAVRRDFEHRMGVRTDSAAGLNVTETDSEVRVSLDLPGVSVDDVELTVQDGCLSISGERKPSTPDGSELLFSNRTFGPFQRTLKLHDSIDPNSVDAVMEDGVLTITMTRRPELQPRRVSVRPSGA